MVLHDFLIDTVYFLVATLALVPLFKYLKLGSMLGYIVAGVIIGPMALGLIDNSKSIVQLAELGITLLLFIVGLELSPARLKQLRNNIIIEGGLQMGVTTLAFFAIGVGLGLSYTSAFVIGVALSLSSTAFALSHMSDTSQLTLSHGQTSLSILLFQDLLIVPFLAILPLLSLNSGTQAPIVISEVLFKVALFGSLIAFCFFALKPAIAIIKRTQDPEISLAAFLSLILVMAIGMEKIGLSMPMGAFVAGVFLANSEVKTNIKSLTIPFKGILMGLFFMTLGVDLNFQFISTNFQQVIFLCLGIVITKSAVLTAIGKLRNGNFKSGMKVSLLLSQSGEFGVVVVGSALHLGILSAEVNKLVATSILITMVVAPFTAKLSRFLGVAVKVKESPIEIIPEETTSESANTDNVVPINAPVSNEKKAA